MEQLNKPDLNAALFNAPIPGQSLTHELGARPWQSPSRFSTLEEVVDYYIKKLNDDSVAQQVLTIIEQKDFSVADMANVIQLNSVMQGVHNIDLGVLVMPIIMEFIMMMADAEGIEYETGLDDESPELKDAAVNKALADFAKQKDAGEAEEEEEQEPEEEPVKGLMSRRA